MSAPAKYAPRNQSDQLAHSAASSSDESSKILIPTVETLCMDFDLRLHPAAIPQWRGAINQQANQQIDLLHNHTSNGGVIYRYPLVHFRSQRGKAQIWSIGPGTDALRTWLTHSNANFYWRGKPRKLRITTLQTAEHQLRISDQPQNYLLRSYLPFNSDNYQQWQQLPTLVARIELLEGILVNHIFIFANAVGWRIPERLTVRLSNIQRQRLATIHGQQRMLFDVEFAANVQLPAGIALGKGVSHGFGLVL